VTETTLAAIQASWQLPPHEEWIKSTGVPIHRGYYIPDLRTIELGYWKERECNAAFLLLEGQERVCEARVTEIPPRASLPPLKFALDELVYVLQGRGNTRVWDGKGTETSFEWGPHSLFRLPRHHFHQFNNLHGSEPVRLLHHNYLPCAMAAIPTPEVFFNNDRWELDIQIGEGLYAEARAVVTDNVGHGEQLRGLSPTWFANFFPDLAIWDRVEDKNRNGRDPRRANVRLFFPDSPLSAHMPIFSQGTYKAAHRHGPGFVIVIPAGEGFSIMFEEGKEKVICPWQEGSVFVPPNLWFHHHFNVGPGPMRYLALHPPGAFARFELVGSPDDIIPYHREDPSVRELFESALAKRGLRSQMPDQAYTEPGFKWGAAD